MNLKEFTIHSIGVHPLVQKLKQQFYENDKSVFVTPQFLADSFVDKCKHLNSNMIKLFQAINKEDPTQVKEIIPYLDQIAMIGTHYVSLNGFYPPLRLLASDEQLSKWEKLVLEGYIIGAYAQTEIGHGSDVQSLQTTATYDKEKKCFIMNSPSISSTKYWAGVMGMHATHIVCQAQTYINGKHYGLQTFVLPIRDPKTYKLLPGVEAGDIGSKLGLFGVDNGYLRFNKYEISRESLLMRFMKIEEDGKVFAQGDKNAVKIGYGGMLSLRVRLAKDFIRDGYKGTLVWYRSCKGGLGPVLRRKLLREFAYIYAGISSTEWITNMHKGFMQTIKTNLKEALEGLDELHLIVSGLKAFYAWEVVERARRFNVERSVANLVVGGTVNIYHDKVPAVTYEGDNVVMLQQTARGLCKYMQYVESGKAAKIPKSFRFLDEYSILINAPEKAIQVDDPESLLDLDKIEEIINVIGVFSVKENYEKMKNAVISGLSMKNQWNEVLQKSMIEMALGITRGLTFKMARKRMASEDVIKKVKAEDAEILKDLLSLYGLNMIQRDIEIACRLDIGSNINEVLQQAEEILMKKLENKLEYIADSNPFSEHELCFVRDFKDFTIREGMRNENINILKEHIQKHVNSFSKL